MKARFILTTVAVALSTIGSAAAADMPVREVYKAPPPPPPVYSWTGCYIGIGGGYGYSNVDHYETATGAPNGGGVAFPVGTVVSAKQTAGGRGWLATGQVGCDYQVGGRFVIGAFGDYDWSDIKGQTDAYAHYFGDGSADAGVGTLRQRSAWAAGGRIGYLVMPQLLTFFSGGWTEARYDAVTYSAKLAPFVGDVTGLQLPAHTYNGWFLGGGTEYALDWFPGLFWKTEYRYSSFRANTAGINCTGPSSAGLIAAGGASCAAAGPSGFSDHSTPHTQTIRSELVYRFNWGGPVTARY